MSKIESVIYKKIDSVYAYEIKNPKNIDKKLYSEHKSFDEIFL